MNGTVEDPLEWRTFADRDLQAARALSQSDDVEIFAYIITFHAHQSAEKYLKGLLVVTGEDPPRIHVLPDLLRRAIAHIPDLDSRSCVSRQPT